MLTATYTLVALSVEQASVRLSLQSFQQYVRNTLLQQNSITLSQLEFACESLHKLYQACHWRKTEMYLIPALRQTTERADHLLDELNRLNQSALTAIRTLQEKMGIFAGMQDFRVEQVCDSIETFCSSMLKRLEKEEQELFAIARAAFAGDTWFSIANQLMMHDKHLEEMKRSAPAAVAPQAAVRQLTDAQITIPGLQVVQVVDDDDEKENMPRTRPARSRPAPRHGLLDEAIAK